MNRKIIPNLLRLPVSLPPMLPQFGNPLLLAQAMHGLQPSKTVQLVPETQHGPRSLVNVNSELCKGCELCIYACPTGNLSLRPELNRKGYHPVVFSFNGTRGPYSLAACVTGFVQTLLSMSSGLIIKRLRRRSLQRETRTVSGPPSSQPRFPTRDSSSHS